MSEGKEQVVKRPRIVALNLMRVFIIAAVIATHIMSSGYLYGSPLSGAVWMVSHTSRNLFVFITALVLMYNYGYQKTLNLKTFYLKRFTLVLLPYAAWTLIYQVKNGIAQGSIGDFVGVYLHNFVTAGAMYHLYFLLISMQIYLFFPFLRYLYRKIKTISPWIVLAISFALQLVMTALMQYSPNIYGLQWWLTNPDNYMFAYQFYIVAGIVLAAQYDTFVATVLRIRKKLYILSGATLVGGLVYYSWQVASGQDPAYVAAVFQPYLVVASGIYGVSLIAFSSQWVKKGMKFSKPVAAIAENSFGIYLSHVLFITYFAQLFQSNSSSWYVGLATLIIGLPVFYGVAYIVSEVARRTRFSVLLTGRKMTPLAFGTTPRPPKSRKKSESTQKILRQAKSEVS